MTDTISLFSAVNTERDFIPSSTARDIYQIIRSLRDQLVRDNKLSLSDLTKFRLHVKDFNNPHHLSSITDLRDSILNTLYLYYKTYFNDDETGAPYSQDELIALIDRDPVALLECLRRIQLNSYRWVDGLSKDNAGNALLKNYFTNDIDIRKHGPKGYSDIPTYSFTRSACPREFPYLPGLSTLTRHSTSATLPYLPKYFMLGQMDETTVSNPAYGLPFGNNSMVTSDMLFMSWDESLIGTKDDAKGIWVLAVSPHYVGIMISPYGINGRYGFVLKIIHFDRTTFSISAMEQQMWDYECDRPACALTFNNTPIGRVTYLKDGVLTSEFIPYPFSYLGPLTTGKVYSSTAIDRYTPPQTFTDPDMNGYPSKDFTAGDSLPVGITNLELSRSTILLGVGGYAPNMSYLAERFAQL